MFKNIGFRRQLSFVFSAGILLLALVTTIVVSKVSTETMHARIISEGKQIAAALAEQSTLALLYSSEETAAEAVEILSAFEDVVGVAVLHKDKKQLYQKGESLEIKGEQIFSHSDQILVRNTENLWEFIAPVVLERQSSEGQTEPLDHEIEVIGYVKILMSKRSLKEMATNIFMYNLAVSVSLAAILLLVLMMISRRLLNPIHHLAEVMSAAQKGKQIQQVTMHGPRDIQEMFNAFNTMMDIIKQREQELKDSRDKAVEVAQLKGEFAANVSHELRTPMNGVLGMLEMLEDTPLSGKEREYLTIAKNSAKSLLLLINDILDFSKHEAGKTILEAEDFDLYEQVEEIVALLGTQSQKKKIELTYIFSENLPRYLIGDVNRLRQLLINLVSNAIKFTEVGIVGIDVSAADQEYLASQDIKIRFSITDTGIGIPLEKQEHIFKAFSQADGSTTRKYGGTGLGLSICKQLVQVMGGEIGVESTPGQGSCFWFDISLKTQKNYASHEEKYVTDKSLQVLILEKNALLQHSLRSMFVRNILPVKIVTDKDDAVNELQNANAQGKPVELLIVNETFGQSEIDELFKQASAIHKNTNFLVLSATAGNSRRENNHCHYLTKPILFNHLMAIIKGIDSGRNDFDNIFNAPALSNKNIESESVFPGYKVLIVDDNPVNQMVAQGLLKPLQCETDTAINGIECLSKIVERPFDVILMDCNMPEMDGYKATQKIREQETAGNHIVIIAITANASPGDRLKCLAAGMDDYLIKPFNREELREKLTRWLTPKNTRN